MRYELKINVLDKKYTDTLIIGLVRQGYSVYYNDEEHPAVICFTIEQDDLTEVKYVKEKA